MDKPVSITWTDARKGGMFRATRASWRGARAPTSGILTPLANTDIDVNSGTAFDQNRRCDTLAHAYLLSAIICGMYSGDATILTTYLALLRGAYAAVALLRLAAA